MDQFYNKSRFEVGKSSTQFKLANLSMYSKNPVTLFAVLCSNYITSSLALSRKEAEWSELFFLVSNDQNVPWGMSPLTNSFFWQGRLFAPHLVMLWDVFGGDRSMLINSMKLQIDKPLFYAATAKDLMGLYLETLWSVRMLLVRIHRGNKSMIANKELWMLPPTSINFPYSGTR